MSSSISVCERIDSSELPESKMQLDRRPSLSKQASRHLASAIDIVSERGVSEAGTSELINAMLVELSPLDIASLYMDFCLKNAKPIKDDPIK